MNQKLHYPLRGVIAIAIGIAIYHAIHTNFSSWILVSIIMLLQTTTGATFKRASFRVIGTVLGVLIGMLIVVVIPYNKPLYFAIVLVDLFLLYYWLRISYPVTMLFSGLGLIVLLTIFYAGGTPEKAWEFAVARVLDTMIGATVVILVGYFFWPSYTKSRLEKEIKETIVVYQAAVEKTMSAFVAPYRREESNIPLEKFYQKIKLLMLQADDASQEPGELLPKIDVVQSVISILFRAYNHCIALEACLPLDENDKEFMSRFLLPLQNMVLNIQALFSEFTTVLPKANAETRLLAPEKIQEDLFRIVTEIYKIEAQQQTFITVNPSGIKLTVLFVNLRALCIDLQYVFAALKQLKKI
jgi:Fusaric acid resistance protein-like